jgi:hypothetical protein
MWIADRCAESGRGRRHVAQQPPAQPGFRELEIAIHGGAHHTQNLRGFLVGASEEKAQFDNPRLPGIENFELRQRAIEIDHILAPGVDPGDLIVQRNPLRLPGGTLQGQRLASVIGKDAAHHHRRESVKMLAIGDIDIRLAHQPQEQLIHQTGSLQRMNPALPPKVALRNVAQVVIGQRCQRRQCFPVTLIPLAQKGSNLAREFLARLHAIKHLTIASEARQYESGIAFARVVCNVRGNVRILQPVIWSKGVFVSPQHLQAQDRFIESLVQFRSEALTFRPWGFTRLQINQEALVGGLFSIHQASGLFPDGPAFDIPDSDAAPPVKSVAEFFGPDDQSVIAGNQSYLLALFCVASINTSLKNNDAASAPYQPVQYVEAPGCVERLVQDHNGPYLTALASLGSVLERLARNNGNIPDDMVEQFKMKPQTHSASPAR